MRDERQPDSHHHHLHHHHHADRFELVISRRERRHRETRDDILAAAREVLLERGAGDLSLREIARHAGFSPGALYKYFDNKDDVIRELAERAMGALCGRPSPPFRRTCLRTSAPSRWAWPSSSSRDTTPRTWRCRPARGDGARAAAVAGASRVEETVLAVFREGVEQGVFTARAGRTRISWRTAPGRWCRPGDARTASAPGGRRRCAPNKGICCRPSSTA